MFIGGDIQEVSFSHDIEGSGVFSPKASEDNELDGGGIRTNDDDSGTTSTGEAIVSQNTKRWSLQVVCANDMQNRLQYEQALRLAAVTTEATWTIQMLNGAVYKGKGILVGDIKLNVNQATFQIKIAGSGKLVKIS